MGEFQEGWYSYRQTLVSTDSVSAVSVMHSLLWPKKIWKIKEIKGAQVSKCAPSQNGP